MRKAIWVVIGIVMVGAILWVAFKPKHNRIVGQEVFVGQRAKKFAPTFPFPITTAGASNYLKKADQGKLKDLLDRYRSATNIDQKREIDLQLQQFVPETREDMELIKSILFAKEWNEELFQICTVLLKNIRDPKLAKDLIEILKKEKKYIGMVEREDLSGESEREAMSRGLLNIFAISKLGLMKSEDAIPILKEYLEYKSTQYSASEALGYIGDESASEKIQEKAYKGEEVNYGGLGLRAAKKIVKDLNDVDKRDKWQNIADQLLNIKDPAAKPYLKELFNHENNFVRDQSSTAYSNLVNINDVPDIKEMAKDKDWVVRDHAIDAMKNVKEESFDDILIGLLLNDSQRAVRYNAAIALGYKQIIKAVPNLEKALNDNELVVRKASFVSLYILTGKKYDFVGRDSLIEWKAEDQRKNPTFFQ